MKGVARTVIVFGVPALAVLGISGLVTLRRATAEAKPQPSRFSGSAVVQRLPSLLPSARLDDAVPVVIVRDDAAVAFYDAPAALDRLIGVWREALEAIGADVRVLPQDVALRDRSARVIVVPSSPCLTVDTRETIESAASRGAGVIMTGAAGIHDGGCRPIGYGLIVGETGASRAEMMSAREMSYVVFPAGSPLTADIPPGARIDLDPGRQIALRHRTRDAFYADYALQPNPARDQPLLDAAVTHTTRNGRRLVYWGFELNEVAKRPWDRAVVQLLLKNSVEWAGGEPVAAIEPWPLGKIAAASIAQDVESGFANARGAVDSLRAAGVRSTFYVTTQLAQRYERLTRRFAASGEVATHGETHRLLGGLPSDEQRARINTTQSEIRALVGSDANGLRPPEEQFDTATMSAWLAAKGTYMFGANDSRVASPELLRVGTDTLVLVGRVGSDDFAAAARRPNVPDTLANIFLGEYDRVRALGGHYVLSYHSQLLAKPELVPALAIVARKLVADTAVWLATVGEVADWWRSRAALDASARMDGDRLRITVRNTSVRRIRDAVVRVSLPESKRVLRAPAKLLPADAKTIRLVLPPLEPKGLRTFVVSLK